MLRLFGFRIVREEALYKTLQEAEDLRKLNAILNETIDFWVIRCEQLEEQLQKHA